MAMAATAVAPPMSTTCFHVCCGQEAEFDEMIVASAKMDADDGHLFDWTLINDDLDVAASELRQLARAVETEPLWVPASWLS